MEEETNKNESEELSASLSDGLNESQNGEVYFHDRDRKSENNI